MLIAKSSIQADHTEAPAEGRSARRRLFEVLEFCDLLSAPAFVLEVDSAGVFRFIGLNKAHEAMSGQDRLDVVGRTPHEVLPPRIADTVLRNYTQCLRSRQGISYEEVLAMPAGEFWWLTNLSPIFDNGHVVGIVGIAQNISNRKLNDQRLAEAVRESRRINRDLQVLTSMTAHDLRGPLRQSRLIYETILDGFVDLGNQKKELLETGKAVIDKALDQIDGILLQMRNVSAQSQCFTEIDFGHVCSDLIALFDPLKSRDFTHPEAVVECEEFMLEVCLRNLVDNALKHGDRRVDVQLRASDEGLVVAVSDDGPGFPEERFVLGEALDEGDAAKGASGFGLASVVQLVGARGGSVWLDEPALGKGATICFSLDGRIVSP